MDDAIVIDDVIVAEENGAIGANEDHRYVFNLESVTAMQVAEFNRAKVSKIDGMKKQIELMKFCLVSGPTEGLDKYVKPYLLMKTAFIAALNANSAEAIGYKYNVEKLTQSELSLIFLYATSNNVEKLSVFIEKYLILKPENVGAVEQLHHAIYSSLSSQLLDAIKDLSKN